MFISFLFLSEERRKKRNQRKKKETGAIINRKFAQKARANFKGQQLRKGWSKISVFFRSKAEEKALTAVSEKASRGDTKLC